MPRYKVTFTVPAEVVVFIDAEDDDTAADTAWEYADEHLRTVAAPNAMDVSVLASLDGIGADNVEEV